MKLRMLVSQMENEDLCQFSYLEEQNECAAYNGSLAKYPQKKLLLVSLECRFHEFGNEVDCILASTNQFSLSEKYNNEDAK